MPNIPNDPCHDKTQPCNKGYKTASTSMRSDQHLWCELSITIVFEPPHGKTNNVVSEQAWHIPACTATEAGQKLEILDLSRGGIVLSE